MSLDNLKLNQYKIEQRSEAIRFLKEVTGQVDLAVSMKDFDGLTRMAHEMSGAMRVSSNMGVFTSEEDERIMAATRGIGQAIVNKSWTTAEINARLLEDAVASL